MGAVLPKPLLTRVLERDGNLKFRVGCCSLNGYRENMEDAHIAYLCDNWAFFGVFDGHAGDQCSQYLEKEWRSVLQAEPFPISDERLKELALQIDAKFLASSTESGSTGTFFLATVKDNGIISMQIGNVGDSRVLAYKNKVAVSLTEDHKPNNEEESARIYEFGGSVENNRVDGNLAVSRAFGDADYKTGTGLQLEQKVIALPDITHCELTFDSNDFALLACDGVFEGSFSNDEVIEFTQQELLKNNDLATVAGNVCDEAIARGSKDNISCMIVQLCNGLDFANKEIECVAGPWSNASHDSFRKAYKFMANKAGSTVGKCLAQRYHLLTQKAENTRTEDEITELQLLTDNVDTTLVGENLEKAFDTYYESNVKSAPADESDKDAQMNPQLRRLQAIQKHLGIPMSMLLDFMQNDKGDDKSNPDSK